MFTQTVRKKYINITVMAQYDSATTNNSKRQNRKFSDIGLDFGRNLVTSDVAVTDVVVLKVSKSTVQTNFYEAA